MKYLKPGQALQYREAGGRARSGIVTAVASQDEVTVRLGHSGTTTVVTRQTGNATRARIFKAGG